MHIPIKTKKTSRSLSDLFNELDGAFNLVGTEASCTDYAQNREAAILKMRAALDETLIMGVETNLDFQYQIMKNPVFCEGKADTGFIESIMKMK